MGISDIEVRRLIYIVSLLIDQGFVQSHADCAADSDLPHYEFCLVSVAGTTAQVCTRCSNLKVATILTNQLCIFNKYG